MISKEEFNKGTTPLERDKCEPKDVYITRLMKVPNIIGCHGLINPPVIKGTRVIANSVYWNKDESFLGKSFTKNQIKRTHKPRINKPRIMSDGDYRLWFIKEFGDKIIYFISGDKAYTIDEIAFHFFGKVYTSLDHSIIKTILIQNKADTVDVDADRYYHKLLGKV